MDPLNWVPAIPTTTAGYPIVGYTTMLLSSCYANPAAGSAINAFLKLQYGTGSTAYTTIIQNNGFAPLKNTKASKYVTAVENDFLGNTSKYNLNIDNATTCASYPGR
jgi:phosphate transport system substrate-binding protein